jgi:hypothetical protein
MADPMDIDVAAAHAHFAVACFHEAWALMERTDRTPEDDLELIDLVHASLHHWRRRPDVAPRHLAVGTWQVARAYALVGRPAEAARWGAASLRYAVDHDLPPFYVGYAHEAMARAAALVGDRAALDRHLAAAAGQADRVEDREERALLEADIGAIRGIPAMGTEP